MLPDEKELVIRAKRGDQKAFRRLVEAYYEMVYAVAYGILSEREDTKDVAQEVFLKAYRQLKNFEGKSKFSTWLYRIAANAAIDQARKRRPVEPLDGVDGDEKKLSLAETLPDGASSPREEASEEERKALVKKALLQLSPEHRAVLVLREWDDMSYEEIAETLKIDIGTVMSRLHYARKKLGEVLGIELSGEDLK